MIERRKERKKKTAVMTRKEYYLSIAKKNDNVMTIFTHEQNENSIMIDWMDV